MSAICTLAVFAPGVYGGDEKRQLITVGPVTQGDADAVLALCRQRGLVQAGLYKSRWEDT